jgi:hypothetical protein
LDPIFQLSILDEDDSTLGKRFYNVDRPVENIAIVSLQEDLEWIRVR